MELHKCPGDTTHSIPLAVRRADEWEQLDLVCHSGDGWHHVIIISKWMRNQITSLS